MEEQNNTMRSHWTILRFANWFLLILRVVQRRQKQSPEAEIRYPGRHTGRVEDRKASGPWQHHSCCGRPAQERWYHNRTCQSGVSTSCGLVPTGQNSVSPLHETPRSLQVLLSLLVVVLYPCKTGRQIQEDILEDILRDILDYTRQRISCTYLGYPKRISVMDKYWRSRICKDM